MCGEADAEELRQSRFPTLGIHARTNLAQGFGARDPYPEEIASDFGNKTLGNYDTEHLVRCAQPQSAQLRVTSVLSSKTRTQLCPSTAEDNKLAAHVTYVGAAADAAGCRQRVASLQSDAIGKHVIRLLVLRCRPPAAMANVIGLRSKRCVPCEAGASPLSDADVENLRRQVPGWKRTEAADGAPAIRHDWKVCALTGGCHISYSGD